MTENQKTFQAAVQSALAEQNLQKRFQLRSDDHDNPKSRTEEPMEIDHIRPQRKCFLSQKGGHLVKLSGEVHCWRCEVDHLKRNCPKNSRY